MATKSRTARSVPLGRGARRTRRGPGVAAGGGGGAAQECRVHFLAADTIILHLRARRQPTASTPAVQAVLASLHPPYAADGSTAARQWRHARGSSPVIALSQLSPGCPGALRQQTYRNSVIRLRAQHYCYLS